MKPLLKNSAIVFVSCLALFTKVNAQENSKLKNLTYKFEYKQEVKNDSLFTLYCVMTVADLLNCKKVSLSYNDKTKQYITQDLLKNKSEEFKIEGDAIWFKINEKLDVPFVIIEGEDSGGKKYNINERNARGEVIDSKQEKEKWQKSIGRVDSMDYIRQFDGVYTGKDGRPRFKDKDGKVYIIEKDHTRPE
jgi:hypothetical protein